MASRLWKFLTTDIREIASLDTIEGTADAAEAVLGLADVLVTEGPNVQKLAPLVTQLDSLLDVLNSPMGKLVGASLPFVSIGTGLLKFYLETTKEEPTLAQSVALISQAAYLESLKEVAQQNSKIQKWLTSASQGLKAKTITPEIKALGQFELSDKEARLATLHFHQSVLAEAFNGALAARLIQLGAPSETANKITSFVAQRTNRHMQAAIADAGDSMKRITEWYRTGGDKVFEKYLSIDTYLEEWIAPRPHEQVFAEDFSFKDIYVPLKAQPLTTAGEIYNTEKSVVLDQWARQLLNDDDQKDRVIFIQGGPGRGKSVFCRMFAEWVRRYEHPRWTPILIRLRDVSVLSKDFEETLAKAVDRDFAKTDSGWLTDRNVRFLFLLDGFDELLMEGRTSGGLDNFLEQVGRFQEQCARNSEKGHRVLITGRTLALQSIESRMPSNLARVDIALMDADLQIKWFNRWSALISDEGPHFKEILNDKILPERIRELSREPLLLYLLAAMYRDRQLRLDMFEGAEGTKAKVLVYERTLDWVLTKQRAEDYRKDVQDPANVTARDLNKDITELDPDSLRRILQEAGLCVVQSGMEFASIKAIESRLVQDSKAKAFLKEAQNKLETDDTPLRNALAAFYLQEGRQGEGSIEFVHKSFGEFLCAERISNCLIDGCQPGRNRDYDIEDAAFCWSMYDLLCCRILTPEIVEYLTALLVKHPDFKAERLHNRLYDFYWRWSEGEFIDAAPENFPQQKMRLLRERSPSRQEKLGQRQIDAYTGLGVMIVLLELHRYGLPPVDSAEKEGNKNNADIGQQSSLPFHPCDDQDTLFSKDKLQQVIGVSHCLGVGSFRQYIGLFLSTADLSSADLSSVNLSSADLSNANLSSTDLRSANFNSANLSSANLSSANLSNADLSSTNFRSADLSSADLSSADLSSADLSSANLSSANLSSANLSSANLSSANLISANLISADLISTDLSSADLSSADLSSADLISADLSSANLSSTDLSSADLSSANLSSANLISADLISADLISADLSSADLRSADFRSADFRSADFRSADVSGAIFSDKYGTIQWDKNTNWNGIRGIDSAIGVPETLKQQLGLTSQEKPET